MPKGRTQKLEGFSAVDELAIVASLAKKVARVVASYPATIANRALSAAVRDPEKLFASIGENQPPPPED